MPIVKLMPYMELGALPNVSETNLPPLDRGNYKTVEIMRGCARRYSTHPVIRNLALKILEQAGTRSHNFLDEARAIGEFVQKEVKYVRDIEGVEQLHSPLYLIEHIKRGTARGDCDDMSLLIATLLLSIGHSPYFAIVRYQDMAGPYNHIYVVEYDKNWGPQPRRRIVLDAILKDRPIGSEVPYRSGKEIKV